MFLASCLVDMLKKSIPVDLHIREFPVGKYIDYFC